LGRCSYAQGVRRRGKGKKRLELVGEGEGEGEGEEGIKTEGEGELELGQGEGQGEELVDSGSETLRTASTNDGGSGSAPGSRFRSVSRRAGIGGEVKQESPGSRRS